MSDETRERTGTVADRKPQILKTTAVGFAGGLGIAWLDWYLDGFGTKGAWQFVMPPRYLIDATAGVLLPTLHLVGRIINNRLSKLAGDAA